AYDYSGTTYGPMETIATPDLSTTGLSLYAVWVPSAGDLQGWQGCDSLASGAVTALTDTRDNNTYAVAKLADGNCWMIENLRLGGSSSVNLTTSNTVTAFTLPASTNTFAATSSDSTTIQMSAKNTLETVSNMATTDAEVYSYGNYYSWPAAIGSTTAYSSNNQSVNTSICPSGWHLPKGGNSNNATNSEFWKLSTAIMNGTTPNVPNNNYSYYDNNVTNTAGKTATAAIRSYPNNFIYPGLLYGSSFDNLGNTGSYWSSTVGNSNLSYTLYLSASGVAPGTNDYNKHYGYSVRCVAGDMPVEPGLASISTMQEMTSDICTITTVGTEKQLRDTRDNKTYWVAKLADGKCWMTQNLDLDLSTSKALTPSDSDVTSNWTPVRGTIDASAVTNNSISGWADDYNTPYSVDPGNWYWNALPFYSSTDNNFLDGSGGTKFRKNIPYANNGEHGHVGNYYNWSATVAMNSTSGYGYNNNPQTSICPKGWRLPTITTEGSTNEFGRLNQLYNSGSTSTSQNLEAAPLYFVRSGRVLSSSQYSAGRYSYYWSSSVSSSDYACNLYFNSSNVNPTNYNYRSDGFSVRCVSR
ncbi:hypothetical protein IKF57_00130, partial [Candidatus Saccharibacteria bacterium]|nr:hypothetical protein [Candidatus Saccharibacteria bacterium]